MIYRHLYNKDIENSSLKEHTLLTLWRLLIKNGVEVNKVFSFLVKTRNYTKLNTTKSGYYLKHPKEMEKLLEKELRTKEEIMDEKLRGVK